MFRPSITALETFVAVARHRGFRKAAAERGISASALSHIIRDLETLLGIRLFNRTNRTVRITATGEQFLHRVAPALSELTEAYEQINTLRDKPRGTLRLNVPRSAAELVIRPLLGRFMSEYPDITLEVVTNDGLVDIVAAGFDAGIRITERLEQDMIAVPVSPQRRFAVVGTPSYFADRSVPRHPGELHNHEGALDGVGVAYVYESLVEKVPSGRKPDPRSRGLVPGDARLFPLLSWAAAYSRYATRIHRGGTNGAPSKPGRTGRRLWHIARLR